LTLFRYAELGGVGDPAAMLAAEETAEQAEQRELKKEGLARKRRAQADQVRRRVTRLCRSCMFSVATHVYSSTLWRKRETYVMQLHTLHTLHTFHTVFYIP
jgi:hypothetical protein